MPIEEAFILGCGYLGLRLAYSLKSNGIYVSASTRNREKAPDLLKHVDKVVLWDHDKKACDLSKIKNLFFTAAPDGPSSYQETFLDNASFLKENLDQMPNLCHFIFTSSTSIYGDQKGIVSEATLPLPKTESSKILLQTEKKLLSLAESRPLKVTILRLGEIIGPNRMIGDKLKRYENKKIPGTGENITNLIHLDDIVRGINFVLENKLDGVFNLTSSYHVTRKQLYSEACRQMLLQEPVWDLNEETIHGGKRLVTSDKITNHGFTIHKNQLTDFL